MVPVPVSDEQKLLFHQAIGQRYFMEIDAKEVNTNINVEGLRALFPSFTFHRYKRASDIQSIIDKEYGINEIHFYSETNRRSGFELSKHFRNSTSHSDHLFESTINGTEVYIFTDSRGDKTSMVAILKKDEWALFIDTLFTNIKQIE